jgi:hypothetical protein
LQPLPPNAALPPSLDYPMFMLGSIFLQNLFRLKVELIYKEVQEEINNKYQSDTNSYLSGTYDQEL